MKWHTNCGEDSRGFKVDVWVFILKFFLIIIILVAAWILVQFTKIGKQEEDKWLSWSGFETPVSE